MLPQAHLIIGIIVSGGLYFIFPEITLLKAGILLASSFLIDFDHYLFYVHKYKDHSLRRAYDFFRREKKKYKLSQKEHRKYFLINFYIFHGLEWALLFFVLGWFIWNPLIFISLGMLLHLITDLIETLRYPDGFEKISVIHDFLKYKRQNTY